MDDVNTILAWMAQRENPTNKAGMARFGINAERAFGIPMVELRPLAKIYKKQHALALELWATKWHEARLLAALIDDPKQVTEAQMEAWAAEFDSWDVVDQCCNKLFDKTPFAYDKALVWTSRPETFVKRAGFVLMATLAVHDKTAPDDTFVAFLPIIEREAADDRNFVKKAVNWALRQIGKRSLPLNEAAIESAKRIQKIDSKTARWIAADALRELSNDKTLQRIR